MSSNSCGYYVESGSCGRAWESRKGISHHPLPNTRWARQVYSWGATTSDTQLMTKASSQESTPKMCSSAVSLSSKRHSKKSHDAKMSKIGHRFAQSFDWIHQLHRELYNPDEVCWLKWIKQWLKLTLLLLPLMQLVSSWVCCESTHGFSVDKWKTYWCFYH